MPLKGSSTLKIWALNTTPFSLLSLTAPVFLSNSPRLLSSSMNKASIGGKKEGKRSSSHPNMKGWAQGLLPEPATWTPTPIPLPKWGEPTGQTAHYVLWTEKRHPLEPQIILLGSLSVTREWSPKAAMGKAKPDNRSQLLVCLECGADQIPTQPE